MQSFSKTSFIVEGSLIATAVGMVLLFLVTRLSFETISNLPAPWLFVTLIYTPLAALLVQLRNTLDGLSTDTEGLLKSEERRLRETIRTKQSHVIYAVFYCLIASITTGLIVWLAFKDPALYKSSSFIIGALLGFGLFLFAWLLYEQKEITSFKETLNDRKRHRTSKSKLKDLK